MESKNILFDMLPSCRQSEIIEGLLRREHTSVKRKQYLLKDKISADACYIFRNVLTSIGKIV